ncbi:hypothetical protein SEVIR_5G186450v4 [Setaria viridis]|uniref:Uncharacterized protein n=1 Tax=Setaria viridis TaxID=4556 RepID=A0A4U6UUD8_SETVI|nr:hypothetical protein SEVIR_5G186450v2 [Setaria viridis]
MLLQLLQNVLRHKYGVAIHLKFLDIRNIDLAIKFFHVIHYPCCEIVVAVNKTATGTPASEGGKLGGSLHRRCHRGSCRSEHREKAWTPAARSMARRTPKSSPWHQQRSWVPARGHPPSLSPWSPPALTPPTSQNPPLHPWSDEAVSTASARKQRAQRLQGSVGEEATRPG